MTMVVFREIKNLPSLNFLFLLILLAVATYSPRPEPVAPELPNRYLARDWNAQNVALTDGRSFLGGE
jgi:hypothetical protein